MKELLIASRGSALSLAQTALVQGLLAKEGVSSRIHIVTTKGDRDQHRPLRQIGGNGLFIREIEKELLDGRADIAVHSGKDLPYDLAEGLVIAGVPAAADSRDCLVCRKGELAKVFGVSSLPQGQSGSDLPPAPDRDGFLPDPGWDGLLQAPGQDGLLPDPAVLAALGPIGTGSARRIRALRELCPAVQTKEIRGNITTRLEKLRRGEYGGIILAKAGLDRLKPDLSDLEIYVFSPEEMIPACVQGILAVECRREDAEIISLLRKISDEATRRRFDVERSLFRELKADCSVAVGIHAEVAPISPDGAGISIHAEASPLPRDRAGGAGENRAGGDGAWALSLSAMLEGKHAHASGTYSEYPFLCRKILEELTETLEGIRGNT